MINLMLDEMKTFKNWLAWEYRTDRDGRKKKVPLDVRTGRACDATTTKNCVDYATAERYAFERDVGIGFVFTDTPFAGIDIDHCIDSDGKISDLAADIVATMQSYTEITPSGHGLHILFKGEVPEILKRENKVAVKHNGLEIYYSGRFFTVTHKIFGNPYPVVKASDRAEKVIEKYLIINTPENSNLTPSARENDTIVYREQGDILEKMFSNEKNGAAIKRLFDGDTSGYNSASEADLALCNHLAFWTGNNAAEMDRLFRRSGLYREKWNEVHGGRSYGTMTIEKAIAGTSKIYNPPAQIGQAQEKKEVQAYPPVAVREVEIDVARENDTTGNNVQADFESEAVSSRLEKFFETVKKNREGAAISTGFFNLDKILDGGFYPGLYMFGANSSTGKTSMLIQIADNIAQAGHGVLFFSLEMSANELIAKSLSRLTLINNMALSNSTKYAKSTRGILLGKYNENERELVAKSIKQYAGYGGNLYITEGVGNVSVSTIKNKVISYTEKHGNPPVVIIDYMQIIAPFDLKMTDKQNTDKNILELKRLSRDLGVPVIGISSFNRESYVQPVSMASFKESGAIEYSSDVLIGLQYDGWDYIDGEKQNDRLFRLDRKMKEIEALTKQGAGVPIQAKILKNRNGIKGDLRFEFFSRFNYFRAVEVENE